MVKVSRVLIGLIFVSLSLTGCSTTRDVSMRTYVQDKKRVDQTVEGALGNWENSPELVDIARKPTRKVYILEFAKDDQRAVTETQQIIDVPAPVEEQSAPPPRRRRVIKKVIHKTSPEVDMPTFDHIDWDTVPVGSASADGSSATEVKAASAVPAISGSYAEYTVQKNDTLQKISKQYYDAFSKWPKIYEANRGVIDDPNNIKPGIVLRIPQ